MTARERTSRNDAELPESGMGGSSDSGAAGHPASAPGIPPAERSALPESVPGDADIERRHHHGSYSGPERRIGQRK